MTPGTTASWICPPKRKRPKKPFSLMTFELLVDYSIFKAAAFHVVLGSIEAFRTV